MREGSYVRLAKEIGANNIGVVDIDLASGSVWRVASVDDDGWLHLEHVSGPVRILTDPHYVTDEAIDVLGGLA